MKKLVLIFLAIFLILNIRSNAQDASPLPNANIKKLIAPNSPIMYFNTVDNGFWVFMGQYGWKRLAGFGDINGKEDKSNKENITVNNDTIKYPTVNLLKTYAAPISGSANYVQVSPSSAQTGNIWMNGTIGGTTAKLTNLTDGYIPYHISDASGLGNSPIRTDGSNVGIGRYTYPAKLDVYGGTIVFENNHTLTSGESQLIINTTGATPSASDSYLLRLRTIGTDRVLFYSDGHSYFSGNVGIGTATPDKLLTVNGEMKATKITLTTGAGANTIMTGDATGLLTFTPKSSINLSSFNNDLTSGWNQAYQNKTGGAVSFDVTSGVNMNLTMSGDATITFSNLASGMNGTIDITNDGSVRAIAFSGYSTVISGAIRKTTNQAWTSGLTNFDEFSWGYNGSVISISGEYDKR